MSTPPPRPSSSDGASAALRVEVLAAVFQVREVEPEVAPALCVLLCRTPDGSGWSLPGGDVVADETLKATARRLVADTVEIEKIAHLEQLAVFSAPNRVPGVRTIASTYLGLVPSDAMATLPSSASWQPVDSLPEVAFDHAEIIDAARHRLAAKLSYTNIAFALAPERFPMSQLSEIYCAALGYPVDTTNLLRILSRRAVVVSTGTVGKTGRSGGRPPALYAFADTRLRVTDEFATLRPPL
ncbi:NUDIX domain-containing protein [Gordonia sp. ABSL11-1]|uniref:NUDIX hydrolase n=1 Tax=Gordonia sp. ABSL11-1 TaxID=3053924 RepID=UPI002572F8C6|nr:NUDIX domain-containing protein [Gordonia sp. ABSL11-1]MDL9944465.1 NUDIX domain-containing protein [Gordonia sp. ABSL11-1]